MKYFKSSLCENLLKIVWKINDSLPKYFDTFLNEIRRNKFKRKYFFLFKIENQTLKMLKLGKKRHFSVNKENMKNAASLKK